MGITRRSFLKTGSLLAVGVTMPSIAGTGLLNISASNTINIGLIGCGSMGWGNLKTFLDNFKECRCVALSDIDKNIMETRAAEIAKMQTVKPALFEDYRKLLDRKDVDIVIIGTPDHWHCLQFVDACAAGKHIYVEKPVSNSIAEADAMVAAARKYNIIAQVGQQQRSSKLWIEMINYIRTGKLGAIGHVHVWANFRYGVLPPAPPDTNIPEGVNYDLWLGPSPKRAFNKQRFHGSWRMFWDYGGGLMTDWGVHLLDMGLWAMNITSLPQAVTSVGGNFFAKDGGHETFDTQTASYKFNDFVMSWENNCGSQTGPYGKNYGVLFKGTNGTLVANRENWQVYPENEKTSEMQVNADNRDREYHVENFLECIKSGNRQTACTIENGALCAKYAQLGNISARLGSATLRYDDVKKTFGNPEADKYLKPQYRAPWKFP